MKQSDPLQLVEEGTLNKPGPIGRSIRMVFGIGCAYALFELIRYRYNITSTPISVIPNIIFMLLAAAYLINYVVNIGFGKSWRKKPLYVSLTGLGVLALISWIITGSVNHAIFGYGLWIWLVYFFSHLCISFVLSAIIASPGCEMRAIPHLFGLITDRAIDEHHCPAGFITNIDAWEQKRSNRTN